MDTSALMAKNKFTTGNSVVIGSGILQALGLRESNDIDMVVTQQVFSRLHKNGNFNEKLVHGRTLLTDGVFEIGTSWEVLGEKWSYEDLREVSVVIDGVRYITPKFLLRAKKSWLANEGRPKDFEDVELLEEYINQKS